MDNELFISAASKVSFKTLAMSAHIAKAALDHLYRMSVYCQKIDLKQSSSFLKR